MQSQESDNLITLKDLYYLCLARWKWFVLSLAVCLGLASLYLLRTVPLYTRMAAVLIKDDSGSSSGKSVSGGAASVFADLGAFQMNANVNNELASFQSPDLMREVVRRLHLETSYSLPGLLRPTPLYGRSLPVRLTFCDLAPERFASLRMTLSGSGAELSDFVVDGREAGGRVRVPYNTAVRTPAGRVIVTREGRLGRGQSEPLAVERVSLYAATQRALGSLQASLSDEKASIIDLRFTDASTARAEDVLSTLIAVYNENWVRDKNQVAVATSMFIDERLGVIEKELGSVDSDISSYKSQNLLPDVQAVSSMYLTQGARASENSQELSNQLYMARYVRQFVGNDANRLQVMPATGFQNPTVSGLINDFNSKLLQRNALAANSSTQNPLVVDMDAALASLRQAVLHSIDNEIAQLGKRLASAQQTEGTANAQIASNPRQAKYLLSVERQQKVKESLYVYLLQKREENELSQAFTSYNTRVIISPMGSMAPSSPSRRNAVLLALLAGVLLPVGLVFLRESMNTRVRGRKDLEGMSMPFVGEVPLAGRPRRLLRRLLRRPGAEPEKDLHPQLVVRDHCRDVANEAFRVVRANMEFLNPAGGGVASHRVIMVTSANPGSGKTFVSANLGAAFALKGQRTLAVDLDLRRASLSGYAGSPQRGMSDWLSGRTDDYQSLIVRGKLCPGLDLLPAGTLPPNPAELLYSRRLQEMVEALREEYDVILLDCPPVEVVADASIVAKQADRTLFVVRAELMERAMLPEIDQFYTEQKYPAMALLLNGTESSGEANRYKYGYKYGYGYGNYK